MGCGGVKAGHKYELRAGLEVKIVGERKMCGQVTRGGSGRGAAEARASGFRLSAPAGMIHAPSGWREGCGAAQDGNETRDLEKHPLC